MKVKEKKQQKSNEFKIISMFTDMNMHARESRHSQKRKQEGEEK
jgi:hypothetical protein